MNNEKEVYRNKYEVAFRIAYDRPIFTDERLKKCVEEAFEKIKLEHAVQDDKLNFKVDSAFIGPFYVRLYLYCDPTYGVHKAITKIKRTLVKQLLDADASLKTRLPSIWTRNNYIRTMTPNIKKNEFVEYLKS
jgi:transposase IS200-family protein